MSAPKLRKGDRIRIVVEGVVERVPAPDYVQMRCDGGDEERPVGFDPTKGYVSVEVLEPAPPAWWPLRDGDVFVDGYGYEFHVIGGRAFCTSPSRRDLDSGMVSPAAVGELLFRDGKPFVDGAE